MIVDHGQPKARHHDRLVCCHHRARRQRLHPDGELPTGGGRGRIGCGRRPHDDADRRRPRCGSRYRPVRPLARPPGQHATHATPDEHAEDNFGTDNDDSRPVAATTGTDDDIDPPAATEAVSL